MSSVEISISINTENVSIEEEKTTLQVEEIKTKEETGDLPEETEKLLDELAKMYNEEITKKINSCNDTFWVLKFDFVEMITDDIKYKPVFEVSLGANLLSKKIRMNFLIESLTFYYINEYNEDECEYQANMQKYLLMQKKYVLLEYNEKSIKSVLKSVYKFINDMRFSTSASRFYESNDYKIREIQTKLFEKQIEEFKCSVCYEASDYDLKTECGHYLCYKCYEKMIELNKKKCPICRKKCLTKFIKDAKSIEKMFGYDSDNSYSDDEDYYNDNDSEDSEDSEDSNINIIVETNESEEKTTT